MSQTQSKIRYKYLGRRQSIQETLQEIGKEIRKNRDYHEGQMNLTGQPNVIIRHHEAIIDYIDNELMPRIAALKARTRQ